MKNVLIADDHALIRQGIRQILSESGEFRVVAEAANCAEARQKLRGRYDAAILDLSMPGGSCLEFVSELKQSPASPPVLILSMYSEEEYGIRVLKAGAAGFLNKECAPELLVAALRKICAGGKFISPTLAEMLASRLGGDGGAPMHQTLSNREHRVLLMIGSGLTATQIARELNLSIKTVSTYRTRILEKLNLKTNAQLIHYALTNGLTEPRGKPDGPV